MNFLILYKMLYNHKCLKNITIGRKVGGYGIQVYMCI